MAELGGGASAGLSAQKKFSRGDMPRILALLGVCLMAVCFWAVFEQQGNTIALYAETTVNRRVYLGNTLFFDIPTE